MIQSLREDRRIDSARRVPCYFIEAVALGVSLVG
jgi:hypothetical protein